MKQKDLAAALGIDPALVSRLKRRGMPTGDPAAAETWRAEHTRRRVALPGLGRSTPAAPPTAPEPPSVVAVPLTGSILENRARREAAEADLAEMRAAELAHQLVRVHDVRACLAKHIIAFRECLLQVPHRLAAQLAAEADQATVHALLDVEIRAALEHLAAADL